MITRLLQYIKAGYPSSLHDWVIFYGFIILPIRVPWVALMLLYRRRGGVYNGQKREQMTSKAWYRIAHPLSTRFNSSPYYKKRSRQKKPRKNKILRHNSIDYVYLCSTNSTVKREPTTTTKDICIPGYKNGPILLLLCFGL